MIGTENYLRVVTLVHERRITLRSFFEPRMSNNLSCSQPIRRIFDEQFGDEVLPLVAHIVKGARREAPLAVFDSLEQLLLGIIEEGELPREAVVDDYPEGPAVDLGPVEFLVNDFRRWVMRKEYRRSS